VDVVVEAVGEGVSDTALAGLTTELTTLLAQTPLQINGEDVALVTTPHFVYTNGDQTTTCTCFLLAVAVAVVVIFVGGVVCCCVVLLFGGGGGGGGGEGWGRGGVLSFSSLICCWCM
jgi:hypothetical protein